MTRLDQPTPRKQGDEAVTSAATFLRLGALVTLTALALALGITATPAEAGLGIACPDPTTQPFQQWSDYANYAYLPDGGFEAGAGGWTLGRGAHVVGGNEDYFVHGSGDRSSLRLAADSSATSPPMCIGLLSSKMRFFIGGPAGSMVKVQVLYNGLLSSVLGVFDGGTMTSDGTWTPSSELSMLGGVVPLLTQSVQFRFVATAGTPQIDDVYLDPWTST
jgi:hypothetical protein